MKSSIKLAKLINKNMNLHENTTPVIEITADKPMGKNSYSVNYQIETENGLMEIEGVLRPFQSGRSDEQLFEPTYFTDPESESYYDDHWEEIEEDILNKFVEEQNKFHGRK